jgi:hypothetical protein
VCGSGPTFPAAIVHSDSTTGASGSGGPKEVSFYPSSRRSSTIIVSSYAKEA